MEAETGLSDEVNKLEVKLKSLILTEVKNLPEIVPGSDSNALVQNDIRNSLKTIGLALQSNQNVPSPGEVSKMLNEILKRPMESAEQCNGNVTGSVLSYLKLLSEVSLAQSSTPEGDKLADTFWIQVIEPIAADILTYLNVHIFQQSFKALSTRTGSKTSEETEETSGAEKVHSSHGTGYAFHQQLGVLLKGVRILLVYLKRAVMSLSKEGACNSSLKSSVTQVLATLASLMDPLKSNNNKTNFDIGLDIRCNIGVGICYSIYYLVYPNEDRIRSFFKDIFTQQQPSSLWLEHEQTILQLAASDTNRIALAFGILNTWLDQHFDEDLYYSIGNNVLSIQHGVKETVNLGSSRVLETWTDKLTRPSIPVAVLKHVSTLFPSLEFFCFMYMPAHIDAVKNCCRNILSSLSQIYDRLDNEKFPPIEQSSVRKTWVSSIFNAILEKQVHIKWIALACVVRKTKKSLILLELDPTLPEQLLTTQRSFKSAASDTYVALMSYHFECVSSEATWVATWIDPLFRAQQSQNHETNWPQKKDIISTILNSEKLKVSHLQGLILPLLKCVVTKMNAKQPGSLMSTYQADKGNDDSENVNYAETSLLAAETIKIAYELKISVDPKQLNLDTVRDSNSAPDDSFRGLVPRFVLNNWLWNQNPQIRLAGFALLVETKKTSDIISKQDFDSLKIFFKYNLLSQDPAFRQQFMSYFKKFARRLKDGESVARRKKDNETAKNYQDFLGWLWYFLSEEEGLFVGANFARRCQALECLSVLTEVFPSGFEIFGLTKAGNTKYLRWLTDSYENNKIEALEIICRMPMEEFEDEMFCASVFNEAMSLCKSIKPPDSVTARYLMTLLLRKSSTKKEYSAIMILESLYTELESLLQKVLSTSLTQVSCETPLYGCVRCIRMILENTDEYKREGYSLKYREYVAKLLKLCLAIDNVMFPVLGSAAPEGFLPGLNDSNSDESKQVVRSLAAQMLLVCAWRTMKEVCLLMSDMCCWFVMEGESNLPSLKKNPVVTSPTNHLLTFDQVSAIGNHLLYLLKNLMHRGVFEQVFVGFKQLATRLWKSSAPKLSYLPEKWLKDAIDQEHISSKSITRRSAGLPFIFQALLSAESDNEAFIQKWVQRLLILDETPEMSPVRIHSMNVLRSLFRDASFSSAMMPFVPHGLRMAFRGLKSLDWTERNSGLMLYGAVMRRTFGAKLNLMNAPTFFRKFPQMYDFLLNELDTCIKLMEIRKNEQDASRRGKQTSRENSDLISETTSVSCDFTFHLLLLLSSFTSSGRVEDTHFKLAEFIPRIRKCGESDDMEVRKLSAKALVPFLISPEDKLELAERLLDDISVDQQILQNKFHGLLVQFLTILCHLPQRESGESENIMCRFLSTISAKAANLSTAAPTIFGTLMEILVSMRTLKSEKISLQYTKALHIVEDSFAKRFIANSRKRNIIPGLPVADKTVANCAIRILFSESTMESVTERLYGYFADSLAQSKAYVDQLLELLLEDEEINSRFGQHLFSKEEPSVETLVLVEAIISNYLSRVVTEFLKFPGTDTELHYLKFMDRIPASVFESLATDNLSQLIKRLFLICDGENDDSTTLQIKAAGFVVLGKIAFSTGINLSPGEQTRLCDVVLQWSASDVDDDMRFAVTNSFPRIPFDNLNKLSGINQAKLWSSILLLAQDDESFIRLIISRKLSDTLGNACCDRKSLEVLMHIYVREFLIPNPVEGFLVIIGLLTREDFEVETKAADDETEDRLFDKSEMNMYFEQHVLIKCIKTEIEASKAFNNERLRYSLDVSLLESQREFFHVLANRNNVEIVTSKDLTIRSMISVCASCDSDSGIKHAYKLDALNTSGTIMAKRLVREFLAEFFKSV